MEKIYNILKKEYLFENKYGKVICIPVTDIMYVGNISGKNLLDCIKFSIEEAEQIALITENKHIQLAFYEKKAYMLVHITASTAVVVKIIGLEYKGDEARKVLSRTISYIC